MKENGVLCAIDVNDFDQQVVELAATFAKQYDVDLHLLHVTLFPNPSHAEWPTYVGSPEQNNDNRLLKGITTEVKGVSVIHHQLSGLPHEEILGFVARNSPQLLVMGTHARKGLERVLGSVSASVMRKASCPVLVLRHKSNSRKETSPGPQKC